MVIGIGAALENMVRLMFWLGEDGDKLCGRVRDDDQIATDFDLNFSVGPSLNKECFGGLRCFSSLNDFLLVTVSAGLVGLFPRCEPFNPSAPHASNSSFHRVTANGATARRLGSAGALGYHGAMGFYC